MWISTVKDLFKKYDEKDLIEANGIIDHEILNYRTISYEDFAIWIKNEKTVTYEIDGESGIEYQIEIYAFWDDWKSGNVRVSMSIDGGAISAS